MADPTPRTKTAEILRLSQTVGLVARERDEARAERDALQAQLEELTKRRDEARESCIVEARRANKATAESLALQARIDAVRQQAEAWRRYEAGAFYPEASAYANAIENCGDALIDLLDEPVAAPGVGPQV